MIRTRGTGILIYQALAAGLLGLSAVAHAGDDTRRFYGTWETIFPSNGQMLTMVSVHDERGYKNYLRLPDGNSSAGEGTFSAANGSYATSAVKPNDSGTYRFINDSTVVCTNAAGQTVTWKRATAPEAEAGGPALSHPVTAPVQPSATTADPSLPPDTNAAIAAFNRKDYNNAWRYFMASAQKGDAEAEAGVGAMLFSHLNPPGTGFYVQSEKWLLAAANQGNVKGMDYLGQYYYATGVSTAGGINPGFNHSAIPAALQREADGRFALARHWFELAAARNDGYAMGNLAIMLDAGVGGPRDPARAAQLRAGVSSHADAGFAARATADPGTLAMSASWQSGHYQDALKTAFALAANGNAAAEAMIGRSYYEGLGVAQSYSAALSWFNKALAKNNADAMFFLGMMYEYGRGVRPDVPKALALFDQGAALGQSFAKLEAAGMRLAGTAAAQQARFAAICSNAGGVADGPLCLSGGAAIDPY